MKYMGKEFKDYQELKAWNKQGHIDYYKKLATLASSNLTMELSIMMTDCAVVLMRQFGLTADEIEEIELACMAV